MEIGTPRRAKERPECAKTRINPKEAEQPLSGRAGREKKLYVLTTMWEQRRELTPAGQADFVGSSRRQKNGVGRLELFLVEKAQLRADQGDNDSNGKGTRALLPPGG